MYDINQFMALRQLMLDGVELTYGKLTLCDLSHYQNFRGKRKWQVFYDSRKSEKDSYYYVFDNLEIAIKKFFEIKNRISNRIR